MRRKYHKFPIVETFGNQNYAPHIIHLDNALKTFYKSFKKKYLSTLRVNFVFFIDSLKDFSFLDIFKNVQF
jgi:hypothetical protein